MRSLLVLPLLVGGGGALVWWMQARLRRQGYRPVQPPSGRRVQHAFDPARSARFRGGSRVGRLNASVPLVTLTIDREWAHLSGLAPVWIDRREVDRVGLIESSLPPGGHGIRFATGDGTLDGVIFWTTAAPAVTDAFAGLGWPVEDAR